MKNRTVAAVSALLLVLPVNCCVGVAYLQGDRIVVAGGDNTLASVARDLADPEVFTFDPDRSAALANRNLLVKGVLSIGSPEAPEPMSSRLQLLEMNISRCGAVRIEVAASPGEVGELHLNRAKLITLHETDDQCKDPNLLIVRGKLVAQESEISGNIECVIEPGASVEMVRSSVSYTQNGALSCELRAGQHVRIRDSSFIDNANYGVRVGSCPDPLELRGCAFRGLSADVYNAGGGELLLTDCDFQTVKFASLSGKVRRKWSVRVEVPGGGLHVVARSAKGNPQQEIVRGVTDKNGECELLLTEHVAFPPKAQEFREGLNNVTPHEIFVYDRDEKTLLYKAENFHVFMKNQRLTFR
jgi:hypothetical protein